MCRKGSDHQVSIKPFALLYINWLLQRRTIEEMEVVQKHQQGDHYVLTTN